MADNNSAQEKTEQATPRKLQQARKKGQVAKSRDLSSALILVAMIILAYAWLNSSAASFQAYLTKYFRTAVNYRLSDEHLTQALFDFSIQTALLVAPVFIVTLLVA